MNILCVSETKWPNSDWIKSNDTYDFVFSGGDHHERSVGILIKKDIRKAVDGVAAISDRILYLRIASYPMAISIIQVYTSTEAAPEDVINEFYEQLEKTLRLAKRGDVKIIMGDFDAKVGKGRVTDTVGNYGLGERNEVGDNLLNLQNAMTYVSQTHGTNNICKDCTHGKVLKTEKTE
ncbi:craniofacial development protein 2-like [Centruroides sculpturatus]|uniref:craniofacial development protein 2-like n=1 Tax=Centruroides sculpturatus TaxID=218467 RepID=UPI000C6E5A99|nr:craniofacial development protein 2-like [Centruroides sculpturatus]